MASLRKKTYTRDLPQNAELFSRQGQRFAKWIDRSGRRRVGRVVTADTGAHAGVDRVVVRGNTWVIRYREPSGRVREISTGCRDKAAAQTVLTEQMKRVDRVKAGVMTAAELTVAEHRDGEIGPYIASYIDHLRSHPSKAGRSGVNPTHLANVQHRLEVIVRECGFHRLHDLNRPAVERWAKRKETEVPPVKTTKGKRQQQAKPPSARTINGYLSTIRAFGNWLVETNKLAANPLAKPPMRDGKANVRRPRRAMSDDEVQRLLAATKIRSLAEHGRAIIPCKPGDKPTDPKSRATWTKAPLTANNLQEAVARARENLQGNPELVDNLERDGEGRALIYKTLLLTGLRKGELGHLTVGDLDLTGAVPYITLAASHEKAGRGAEIPVRADLAADLRSWLADRLAELQAQARTDGRSIPARLPADTPLLPVPDGLVRMFDRDLLAAGIEKTTDEGTLDVHALRHTFATNLSRAGVSPQVAQKAMRHSSVELTLGVYTHLRLSDTAGAVELLPDFPLDNDRQQVAIRATGTNDQPADTPADIMAQQNSDAPDKSMPKLCPALPPNLPPTAAQSGQIRSNAGQTAPSGRIVKSCVSVGDNKSCASMSSAVLIRRSGFEPETFGSVEREQELQTLAEQGVTDTPPSVSPNTSPENPNPQQMAPSEHPPADPGVAPDVHPMGDDQAQPADPVGGDDQLQAGDLMAGEHPIQPIAPGSDPASDNFAAALAMVAQLPLSPDEKAQAVRMLMAEHNHRAD